ncbi:hypothetical protein FDECE_17663, partial [Fusarium decemcellulare]
VLIPVSASAAAVNSPDSNSDSAGTRPQAHEASRASHSRSIRLSCRHIPPSALLIAIGTADLPGKPESARHEPRGTSPTIFRLPWPSCRSSIHKPQRPSAAAVAEQIDNHDDDDDEDQVGGRFDFCRDQDLKTRDGPHRSSHSSRV